MKEINIYGDNRFEKTTKIRETCRGIVVRDGKLLLYHEIKTDLWMIPGGGVEEDESREACCIRELAEETGFIVKPLRQYLTVNEYYEEYLYTSFYYICEAIGQTEQRLSQREKEVGVEPRWLTLEEAISIFSRHRDYAANEEKRGMYLREHHALTEYLRDVQTK